MRNGSTRWGAEPMLLAVRRAQAEDVPVLVDLYHRAYTDGYSATFDKYGSVRPADFWWVQSEKEVFLVDVNGRPQGLVIIGRRRDALVVEEVLGDLLPADAAAASPGAPLLSRPAQSVVQRLGTFVLQHARRSRQDRLLLRAAEGNALALHVARHLDLVFSNALVVSALRPRGRATPRLPEGYAMRKAVAADVAEIGRIHRECALTPPHADALTRMLRDPNARAALAERGGYPVGFLLGSARDGGFGDLVIGVRETHRRRGVGRALAIPALNFFHARGIPAVGLYWGLDAPAHGFYRGLGFATERVYLFFEKRL